jgi:predicted nucleic acid-binding protein
MTPPWGTFGTFCSIKLEEGLTTYDSCQAALAQRIATKVITNDEELLKKFP